MAKVFWNFDRVSPDPKTGDTIMTNKEIVKAAFASAEKEAREKQVNEVKKIVTRTLEKLDAVKKEIKAKQEEERILKMDIDDLKEGRLDRIAERQEKDPEAKKVSVVLIIKEKEVVHVPSPWYSPYTVVWQYYTPTFSPSTVMYSGTGGSVGIATGGSYTTSSCSGFNGVSMSNSIGSKSCNLSDGSNFVATVTPTCITGSVAKFATVGSYDVNGHIINLR